MASGDEFVHFERPHGPGFHVRAALADAVKALHEQAMRYTVTAGYPGVLGDAKLAELNPDPAVVDELVRARMWERAMKRDAWLGYRILDEQELERAIAVWREAFRARYIAGLDPSGYVPRGNGHPGYFLYAPYAEAALEMNTTAVIRSVVAGHPGFISAPMVAQLAPDVESAKAIAALHQAGMWDHVEDGYRVKDQQTVDAAIKASGQADVVRAACVEAGGHVPKPGDTVTAPSGEELSKCSECDLLIAPDDPIRPT
jgi:hypothetical protein